MPPTLDPRECPQDLDAERGLLGRLILDPDCHISLPKERFFSSEHRKLYGLIETIRGEGLTVTPEAVAARLPARSPQQRQQELQYLQQIVQTALHPPSNSPQSRATDPTAVQRKGRAADSTAGSSTAPFSSDSGRRSKIRRGGTPDSALIFLARINDAWCRRGLIELATSARRRAMDPKMSCGEALAMLDASSFAIDFSPTRFARTTASELNAKTFQQRYLIPGVLAAGEAGGIYGPFKTRKTSCAVDLLVSVATGTPFLGHFPVAESGPVMLLTGETPAAALQSLLRRVCRAHGVDPNTLDNFHFSSEMPDVFESSELAQLRHMIRTLDLKLLVIDPAYLAVALEEPARNISAMQKFLRPMRRLCEETGCSVLVVHHCRRDVADAYRPGKLSDVAWNGCGEFSDQWIMLSRRRACDPQSGEHELWLSSGGRAGHAGVWAVDIDEGPAPAPTAADASFAGSSVPESFNPKSKIQNPKSIGPDWADDRRWSVTVLPAEQARVLADGRDQVIRDQRRERRMLALSDRDRQLTTDLLQRYPQGETATILRDLLGFSGSRMTRVLAALIEAGVVETIPAIHGRRGATGYRLIDVREADINRAGEQESRGTGEKTKGSNGQHAHDPIARAEPVEPACGPLIPCSPEQATDLAAADLQPTSGVEDKDKQTGHEAAANRIQGPDGTIDVRDADINRAGDQESRRAGEKTKSGQRGHTESAAACGPLIHCSPDQATDIVAADIDGHGPGEKQLSAGERPATRDPPIDSERASTA